MKFFLFILTGIITFVIGYAISLFALEIYLRKRFSDHKKEIDRKIMKAMFRELGFTYRETASGKGFLIIDEYKGKKAIQV